MMQKSLELRNQAMLYLSALLIIFSFQKTSAQIIYQHDFGTTFVGDYPYTVSPVTINPNITGSQWTNHIGSWLQLVGSPGQALGVSVANGEPNANLTLTFNVAPGYALDISSFSFHRQRSPSGPQNWSMTINGINVGAGTVPTTITPTGALAVSNPVTGLSGTVTIVMSLTGNTGGGVYRIDNFTLNGTVISTCIPPVISSISPASGSAGTIVTINGSGFQSGSGTTAVEFNGIPATEFTVVSNTEIKATVPAGATSGIVTVTTNACDANTAPFTVINSNCPPTTPSTDLYISELYDHVPGSYGVIELYNPTGNTITFNGEYVLERYGNVGDGSPSYTLVLPGSIGPEMTYLVLSYGTGVMGCAAVTDASMGQGINDNDEFKLKKNGTLIDMARAPGNTGYSVIRQPDAVAPTTAYNNADWNFNGMSCTDLGSHLADPVAPSAAIITQPQDDSVCENGQATLTVGLNNGTGFTYQWKTLNATGNWVNITNNANYSGAASATLTINNVPASFDNNQYYCEIVSGSCTLVTNTVQLELLPSPDVATVMTAQPTCTTATGAITVTAPLGAGITYSINGTTFQLGTVFSNLIPGNYSITVRNADGCTSVTSAITINPAPATPAVADVTVTQPTCANPTGTITINTPVEAGLNYSINGLDFQLSNIFTGLAPGSYPVTVRNSDGCTSTAPAVTINPAPASPAVADVTVTQPTCTTPTGVITIDSPVGTGFTYSINGTDFQEEPSFDALPGTYTITVMNADGCTSVTADIIINTMPGAPAVADVTVTQPTCTVPTGVITVNTPAGAGLTYSINGTDFQAGTTFSNLIPGTYTITVRNAAGCTSVTPAITIDTVPNAPAVADISVSHPTCTDPTGSIIVDSPIGTGFTYSINGVNFQTAVIFVNLAPGNYNITVRNADGCTSITPTITINAVPAAPAVATVSVTQPTCILPTGTITVDDPISNTITYSIDGVDFQLDNVFTNLNPGTYTITVRNADGCTSVTTPITIDPVPGAPATANVTVAQPSCIATSGTITINSPTGNDFTYSINGTDFQGGTTFTNLNPGTYTVTVRTNAGCTSETSATVNTVTGTPQISTVQECRNIISGGQDYILEGLPLDNSFNAETASYEWTNESNTVIGAENIFDVTAYVIANNISDDEFPMTITLTVTTPDGCEATADFMVESYFCNIPRGISPNGDGMNDNFDLIGLNVKKLSIFNRYGQNVYSRSDYKNEWHGQTDNGNELPTGTYYYSMEISGSPSKTGWIYINRQQ